MNPIPAHTKPCDKCSGTGCLPRAVRTLPDGRMDPTDTIVWPSETCDKCGGSGMMRYDPGTVAAE